jgi:2-oxoisovalerate dehydrogenase E1 component
MARLKPLKSDTIWARFEVGEADWKHEEPAALARYLEQLLLIRRFEEVLLELWSEKLVHGPAHASIGQEAGAVGAMSVLASDDKINGTHRMHHQFLAKVLNHVTAEGYDPRAQAPTEAMTQVVHRTLAEILGLAPGYCGGRGGSMHLRYAEAGVMGSSASIGSNLPHAVGYALADKLAGRDAISVSFFGDGTLMNGAAYPPTSASRPGRPGWRPAPRASGSPRSKWTAWTSWRSARPWNGPARRSARTGAPCSSRS